MELFQVFHDNNHRGTFVLGGGLTEKFPKRIFQYLGCQSVCPDILASSLLKQKLLVYFLANFWGKLGSFLVQHLVTLVSFGL